MPKCGTVGDKRCKRAAYWRDRLCQRSVLAFGREGGNFMDHFPNEQGLRFSCVNGAVAEKPQKCMIPVFHRKGDGEIPMLENVCSHTFCCVA